MVKLFMEKYGNGSSAIEETFLARAYVLATKGADLDMPGLYLPGTWSLHCREKEGIECARGLFGVRVGIWG